MEQTLIVFKPDAVARGLIGQITARFERVGLKIVAAKLLKVNTELANKHYPLSRREFIEGMGNKTLENFKSLGMDANREMGTENAYEIGKIIQGWLVTAITSSPVFALVLEGPHAVELVRKLVGHTLPIKSAPGTIRGDYSFDSSYLANTNKRLIKNLLHASGNIDEAKHEIALWFTPAEIYQYERSDEKAMK